MGKQAADALAAAIGKKGKVAWIFHDAQYYVTNQRDNAFKTTIQKDYPDIEIVAEQGLADPARAEEIANALLLKNPDLDGIYVTWAEPAEGVLAALRAAGNTQTKIVTLDLSEPIALDMVQGGNVAAIIADQAYELGRAMATVGGLRPARQGGAALRRGAGNDRDQGERRAGLSGIAAPRRAAERDRREQIAARKPIAVQERSARLSRPADRAREDSNENPARLFERHRRGRGCIPGLRRAALASRPTPPARTARARRLPAP